MDMAGYNSEQLHIEQVDLDVDPSDLDIQKQGSDNPLSPQLRTPTKADKNLIIDMKLIQDHKLDDDDVKAISTNKLLAMNRFDRFEYRFPFYRMDVNGYQVHIK